MNLQLEQYWFSFRVKEINSLINWPFKKNSSLIKIIVKWYFNYNKEKNGKTVYKMKLLH